MLCTNLVVKQLYTDVQLLNSLFQKAYGEGIIPYVPLLKILNVSERTRMSVVPCSSDVFAMQKLASRSVHGCTLLDRLFSKGLRKGYYTVCAATENPQRTRTDRMSVVPRSSDVFALFNRASTASLCQKRVPLYAFQHHIAERFISYTCNENRIVVA